MLFTEPIFLFVFLPWTLAVCALGSLRTRNVALAGASILFYAWDYLDYAAILCASIAGNYLLGLAVEPGRRAGFRLTAVAVGIALNLGLLFTYKYAGFLVANLNLLRERLGFAPWEAPDPVMPLGISFFTFQAMSYVLDVYRGKVSAQRNPANLALYIALFPQLIAGPIVRYHEIVRQITHRTTSNHRFNRGARRFVVGLAKKLLVADTLAGPATLVFEMPLTDLTTPLAWVGLVCFTLQIYFDFSGYSDMAIGLGHLFGFRIPENFNLPYTARSVSEFWRRWHMTLSRWFRDYVYIPLGGNRRSPERTYMNLFAVFLLCGLWHGASWNFVLWGTLHGMFLTVERIGRTASPSKPPAALARAYTLAAVMLGWVFFQCPTVAHAAGFVGVLCGNELGGRTYYLARDLCSNSVVLATVCGTLGAGGALPAIRGGTAAWIRRQRNHTSRRWRRAWGRGAGDAVLLALFIACCLRLSATTFTPFLYFRF